MSESSKGEITPLRPLDGLRVARVRQRWAQPNIQDVPAAVRGALRESGALERIAPGASVAITAGSRGIAALPTVIRTIVQAVREAGGAPFIFPAMGSHGGGTAEGQVSLLAGLGISEETMGAPIRATMEVVSLGETPRGRARLPGCHRRPGRRHHPREPHQKAHEL